MRYITGVRPYTILDLYCGAGGAAIGYHRAGFNVIGVDNKPMPRYPFTFVQFDALEYLKTMIAWPDSGWQIDAVHASPPCQHYSAATKCRPGLADRYPDLIEPTRELLIELGLPYVIENVPGAPLVDPVWLCGSQFNRQTVLPGYGPIMLRRHRGFEATFDIPDAGPHDHTLRAAPVYGHGPSGKHNPMSMKGVAQACREVMGIDWMTRDELDEAIPPVYTNYVGKHLMNALTSRDGLELAA